MALIQGNVAAQASTAQARIEFLYAGWPPFILASLAGANTIDQDNPYPLFAPVTVLEIVSAEVMGGGRGPENRTARMGERRTDLLRGYLNVLIRMTNLLTDRFLDRDGVRVGLEVAATTFMRGPLDLDGNKISGMAAATEAQDLVTRAQFRTVQFLYEDKRDEADQAVLRRDGANAMGADLDMGVGLPGRRVINVGIPSQPGHVVIDAYLDSVLAGFTSAYLPRTGVNVMTNAGTPWSCPSGIRGMANPINPDDAVTKVHFDSLASTGGTAGVPIGMVMPHMGGSVPVGFLPCDGREVSRVTYAALFAIIGIAYGAPSSGTTFVLPDLRGRVVIGADNMGGVVAARVAASWASQLAGAGGTQTHSLSTSEISSHSHGFVDRYMGSGSGGALTGETTPSSAASGFASSAGVTATEGSGNGHNNVQPVMAVAYMIRSG